jgi:DNA-directed RNA polymerase
MTNQSPFWQASHDRFIRANKLWTRRGHRIHAMKTDFGQRIVGRIVHDLAAFLDGKKMDREGQPILLLSPPDDMGPALYSLGTENLALATLAPLVDGIMRGWSPGPDRRRMVCERIGRFLADTHTAFEDSDRVARVQIGNWLLDAAMTLDAFDVDAAGYPAWSEEFQPSVNAIRDELIRLRCLLQPHTTEPQPWTGWRSHYEDSLSTTFVASVYPETRALITEAFRDPDWEHARGINTLQRVPFAIDPAILDLVDRFAVKVMGRSGKQRFNDHRAVNSDIDTANFLLGEPFWLSYHCDWRGRLIPNQHFNFVREDHVRAMFRFANGVPIDDEGRYWLKVHAANSHGQTDKDWFGDRVAWADKNRSLIERIAADPVATFQEWRDVDKPFAFVAACRELVAAGDKNFITHLPISFDGRANGIAHLALIAKDRAAAEMVNLLESDERHDIYSEVARRLCSLQECFSDLTDKELRALVKRPVMTYGYSVTEQGMSRQKYETYVELRGDPPPKGASLALAKQIEAVLVELLPGPARIRQWIRAITQSRADEGRFLQWKTPTAFPVINRYEEPLVHELLLKMRTGGGAIRYRPRVADGHTGKILNKDALNGSAPNFVHSMDAAHLIRVVLASAKEDITDIVTVHDSFACLAPHSAFPGPHRYG